MDSVVIAVETNVTIEGHEIGPGSPPFVVAEAGVNHNGDPSLAHDLVDAAARAGADAVKFQTFRADKLAGPSAPKADYQQGETDHASQTEMLAELELPRETYRDLQERARKRGLLFLSSPFDVGSVRFLDGLGVPAFKIPSGEITNLPYLQAIGQTGRPAILSTGMSTLSEVERAVDALDPDSGDLVLLHCLSEYPAPPDEVNLRAMDTLRQAFGTPVGFSDHTAGSTVTVAAAARGAALIEKHFTLDSNLPGPDHSSSLEFDEFDEMVDKVRDVHEALGSGRKEVAPSEKGNREVVRKSLALADSLGAGTSITENDLVCIRPATGIEPPDRDQVIGRTLSVDKPARRPLVWEDFR